MICKVSKSGVDRCSNIADRAGLDLDASFDRYLRMMLTGFDFADPDVAYYNWPIW